METKAGWLMYVAEILEEIVADRIDHEAVQGVATELCECLQRVEKLLAAEGVTIPTCHIYEFETHVRSGIELAWYVAPKTLTAKFAKNWLQLCQKSKGGVLGMPGFQCAVTCAPHNHQQVADCLRWLLAPDTK